MTLPEVGGHAAIIRVRSRTLAGVLLARQTYLGALMLEDDDLALIRLRGNADDPTSWLRELNALHWRLGEDYVLVNGHSGVIGNTPAWLSVALAPTGNPPELEARMDPEIRAMWENSRRLSYTFKRPLQPATATQPLLENQSPGPALRNGEA